MSFKFFDDENLRALEEVFYLFILLAFQCLGASKADSNVEFPVKLIRKSQVVWLIFDKIKQILYLLLLMNLDNYVPAFRYSDFEHDPCVESLEFC